MDGRSSSDIPVVIELALLQYGHWRLLPRAGPIADDADPALARFSANWIDARTPESWRETGRRVRVVDGTTLSLPDTPANQAGYPQPRNQRPGLGFPLCRLVAAFDLADGTMVNAAIGGYRGKGAAEQTLLRTLLDDLACDDILLGGALFSTYFLWDELGNAVSTRCSRNTGRGGVRPIFGADSGSVLATI